MIAVSDTIWNLLATSPLAFLLGVGVGFLLSNRYRISRRNGASHEEA